MLIEKYKTIQAFGPKTTNTAITSTYVNLKNAITALVIVNLTQAVEHETEISLYEAKDTEGADTKLLSNNVVILANEDVAESDELVRKPDGVNYKVQKTAKNKQVTFSVDPAKLDVNNEFCCLNVRLGASSQATNFASGEFILENKYPQEEPPSAVVD